MSRSELSWASRGAELDKFPFLSDEWTTEVKRLHDEIVTEPAATSRSVRMNLVLTESPIGDGTIEGHLDTSSGRFHSGQGPP